MEIKHIRNFSIIAHIDHGKSTLADRLLEYTNTVPKRKMKEQLLDQMDLERERGITIKMQPVRMEHKNDGVSYVLNLIDTPGHIDFSYEVSRALKAVEGTILLVDATQGIQAQTLSVLEMAREQNLVIIPVLNKIDLPNARPEDVKNEIVALLECLPEEILLVSAKEGSGVDLLLDAVVKKIPAPKESVGTRSPQALIFDFAYSDHQGIIVFIRMFSGVIGRNADLMFLSQQKRFQANECGVFVPDRIKKETLSAGEIGYVVTGIKEPGLVGVGDTITSYTEPAGVISGFKNPQPVVWASLYPESQDGYDALRQALLRLKLSDSSISFSEEASSVLGRGFRAGFLGLLHLEIIVERLKREFSLTPVIASPTIRYEVLLPDQTRKMVYSPTQFPDHGTYISAFEPWVMVTIIAPKEYLGAILKLIYEHEGEGGEVETRAMGKTSLLARMPLRELMRNFFDALKSATSGYASLLYIIEETMHEAEITRLDILVAEEVVPAFSRIVSLRRVDNEAEEIVEHLKEIMPRQLFVLKIQARALGRIVASRTISALKKNVTAKLYGGDITRKMKLREKQKKGKKRLQSHGRVAIPHEVFLKVIRGEQ